MDIFFKANGVSGINITRELYEAWTVRKCAEKPTTTAKRRSAILGFSRYLVSRGYDDIYTGFDDCRTFKSDFIPYIFSSDEIGCIFRKLDDNCRLNPGYDTNVFRLIMQVFYCCGLRKSELLGLLVKDVDFSLGRISVMHGKNDVSRLILASESLKARLDIFRIEYLRDADPGSALFYGGKGERHREDTLYRRFHSLLDESGIRRLSNGKRQRLHDIRHTFCVRALEQMQTKGYDLYTSLPLLSTYLGHKHITETEYYLRMLDRHFDGILENAASYSGSLFPRISSTAGGADDEE
jgi:integrase